MSLLSKLQTAKGIVRDGCRSLIEWMKPSVLVFFKAPVTVVVLFHHNQGKFLHDFSLDVASRDSSS